MPDFRTPFTTANRVRMEAGFVGNTNILNADIETILQQVHGTVLSSLQTCYNVVVFTGDRFDNSQAKDMLSRVEELIAAGTLLIHQYGIEARNTMGDGYERKKEGEKLLGKLIDKQQPTFLLDNTGQVYQRKETNPAGAITASGAVPGANKFSVNDQY